MINKENLVPDNTIVVVPHFKNDDSYLQILQPLRGQARRDWFGEGFYYCLPLTIGNQYGFIIKSIRSFSVEWYGGESPAIITINDGSNDRYQSIENVFGYGIVSIQNRFTLRTPPGVNLMTIQPPNIFIPNMAAMTGVVEADNLGRDFTFNMKMTCPGKVDVNAGDVLGAFIPIPRYFVENFEIKHVLEVFDQDTMNEEMEEFDRLVNLRRTEDINKRYNAGRLYFNGLDSKGNKFKDHQGGKLV